MLDNNIMLQALEASQSRRAERRRFLKYMGGGAVAVGGLSLIAACDDNGTEGPPEGNPTPTPTPAPVATDVNVLNFALNLEYLEATFYSFAVNGQGLPAIDTTGVGTPGTVTGGKKVTFTDPMVAAYAREIAQDEAAHVNFLRSTLGSAAISLPDLNIDGSTATGAFSLAAQAAGLVPAGGTFDPYASDVNFLLGAFIFEDVGVTAYKGGSTLITNKTYLEAAAGILAAEAYHAGLIRTTLYAKGLATPSIRTSTDAISNARDSVDGPSDDDQGISSMDGGVSSNIVPTDANGIAFSRNVGQVHNVVYLTKNAASSGGFFPTGTRNADPSLTKSQQN